MVRTLLKIVDVLIKEDGQHSVGGQNIRCKCIIIVYNRKVSCGPKPSSNDFVTVLYRTSAEVTVMDFSHLKWNDNPI